MEKNLLKKHLDFNYGSRRARRINFIAHQASAVDWNKTSERPLKKPFSRLAIL